MNLKPDNQSGRVGMSWPSPSLLITSKCVLPWWLRWWICSLSFELQEQSKYYLIFQYFHWRYDALQIVLWVVAPTLIARGLTTKVMTVFLIMFLVQYIPKIYHAVCLLRRMQLSGYVFGSIWWGITLNLIAYFVASHVSSPSISSVWILGIRFHLTEFTRNLWYQREKER